MTLAVSAKDRRICVGGSAGTLQLVSGFNSLSGERGFSYGYSSDDSSKTRIPFGNDKQRELRLRR
ncbi:MAG TPA: hypothetical protein VFE22_10735, partial [Edaphobacter sp.]|nr:hypothetical protein [Edaphobacter sp.]